MHDPAFVFWSRALSDFEPSAFWLSLKNGFVCTGPSALSDFEPSAFCHFPKALFPQPPGVLPSGTRLSMSPADRLPEVLKEEVPVTITFNHAILAAHDREVSAAFYAALFGLPEPTRWGPFTFVRLDGLAHLQFASVPEGAEIHMQHYAFLVDDLCFDQIHHRLQQMGITHWADPQMQRSGEINTHYGGRGVYFRDPAGHGLEVITRPYVLD